ncbi:MAG: hypothetical protein IIY12_02195, partial [Clostridia bacterium]|nr:hypothetical protein [Clostridia bacterium]
MKDTFITLYTSEGETLSGQPWNIYPRPQMKRDSFFCLNGEWDFCANGGATEKITVPFPPESALSGIGRRMGKDPEVRYQKKFTLGKFSGAAECSVTSNGNNAVQTQEFTRGNSLFL